MTFQVIHQSHPKPAQSPYRIVQHETGREVIWANRFLDRECIRCLAETTLRSYALDLLHFLRWWVSVHQTDTVTEKALTESTLAGICPFPSRPVTPACGRHHQPPRSRGRSCAQKRIPQRSCPVRSRLSPTLLETISDERGAAASGLKPPARQGAQTRDSTAVGGRSCAVLVQFPCLALRRYPKLTQ